MRMMTWTLLLAVACGGGKGDSGDTDGPVFGSLGGGGDDETADTATGGGGGGTTLPTDVSLPGGQLIITWPTEGEAVLGPDIDVEWEAEGCNISSPSADSGGCHIHRFVDGANMNPFGHYETVPYEVTDLDIGEHTLEIWLVRNDGSDAPFEPLISDAVTFNVYINVWDTDTDTDTDTDPTEPETWDLVVEGDGFGPLEGVEIYAQVIVQASGDVIADDSEPVTDAMFGFAWVGLLDGTDVYVDWFADVDADGACGPGDQSWRRELAAPLEDTVVAADPRDPTSEAACDAF